MFNPHSFWVPNQRRYRSEAEAVAERRAEESKRKADARLDALTRKEAALQRVRTLRLDTEDGIVGVGGSGGDEKVISPFRLSRTTSSETRDGEWTSAPRRRSMLDVEEGSASTSGSAPASISQDRKRDSSIGYTASSPSTSTFGSVPVDAAALAAHVLEPPSYNACTSSSASDPDPPPSFSQVTLTIDRTGTQILCSPTLALYAVSAPLNSTSKSVDLLRLYHKANASSSFSSDTKVAVQDSKTSSIIKSTPLAIYSLTRGIRTHTIVPRLESNPLSWDGFPISVTRALNTRTWDISIPEVERGKDVDANTKGELLRGKDALLTRKLWTARPSGRAGMTEWRNEAGTPCAEDEEFLNGRRLRIYGDLMREEMDLLVAAWCASIWNR